MLQKNKKSQVLWYLLLGGILVGIITFYTYLTKPATPTGYIGEYSFLLLDTMYKAEAPLFFIDQAAFLQSENILTQQAFRGGFSAPFPCGMYAGYTLWQNQDQACNPNPDEIKHNFLSLFKNRLFADLDIYPDPKIPLDDYEIQLIGNKLVGIATMPIAFIMYGKGDFVGKYAIKPSFEIDFNYDFSDYAEMTSKLQEITKDCSSASNLLACVNRKISQFNHESNRLQWSLDCQSMIRMEQYERERTFGFCVENLNIKFPTYMDGKVQSKNIVYKFGAYIPGQEQQQAQ